MKFLRELRHILSLIRGFCEQLWKKVPVEKFYNFYRRIRERRTQVKVRSWIGVSASLITIACFVYSVVTFIPWPSSSPVQGIPKDDPPLPDIPTENKIWEEDLIDQTRFRYLLYSNEKLKAKEERALNPKFRVEDIGGRVRFVIPRNTTLEITRPVEIRRYHLGRIFLSLTADYLFGLANEPAFAYLLVEGKDPAILDTFSLKGPLKGKYNITSYAGVKTTFLLRVSSQKDQELTLVLQKLFIKSEPPGGTVVIQAIQSWDGRNLDGYSDDFHYRIEKIDNNQCLFWQKEKMARDGFTEIKNLQPNQYMIKGVLNSIVLGEVGRIELTDELGWFKQFRVRQSRPIEVRVFCIDGVTPVFGAEIFVETNRLEGGPVRGGETPEHRILTDKNGASNIWLFPAMNPDEDYYVIRVRHDGLDVGKKAYRLGYSEDYEHIVNIVTDLSLIQSS